jgi:hypothetical protein
MIEEGRIKMTKRASAAVDELVDEHGRGSLSRRDAGEKGPVVLKVGGKQFEIDDDGTTREV